MGPPVNHLHPQQLTRDWMALGGPVRNSNHRGPAGPGRWWKGDPQSGQTSGDTLVGGLCCQEIKRQQPAERLTPANFSKQEERKQGRQEGWRRAGVWSQLQQISGRCPSLSRPWLPFMLLLSHHPQWQEMGRLPFDLSGMFSSSIPTAAAAAELSAPWRSGRSQTALSIHPHAHLHTRMDDAESLVFSPDVTR